MIRFPHPGSIDGFKTTLGGMVRQPTKCVHLKSFVPLPLRIQDVTSVHLIKMSKKDKLSFRKCHLCTSVGVQWRYVTQPNRARTHTHTHMKQLFDTFWLKFRRYLIYKRKVNEFVNLVSLEKAFCSDRRKHKVRWRCQVT